ncbi:growth/differentiation factor 8 [Biomphalaria pfeifferi]|uniref:Growth/differentiation factor 8 n=1 Tax=Biomphalaria pfeifferi TaxID=112525 RepID=A0AAD8FBZ6_BIOPF|nr:growth/differentiation factor 8 [Biomphalaria pfeifferi]
MSNLAPHAFISLLALLLMSGTNVHSLHTKSLSNSSNNKKSNQHQNGFTEDSSLSNKDYTWDSNNDINNISDTKTSKFIANELELEQNNNKIFNSSLVFKLSDNENDQLSSYLINSTQSAQDIFHSRDIDVNNEHNTSSDFNSTTDDELVKNVGERELGLPFSFDEGENTTLLLNNAYTNLSHFNVSFENYADIKAKTSHCLSCQIRNDSRDFRIQSIKHQILKHLNFKSLPNATRNAIPKMPALYHIYNANPELLNDDPHSHGHESDTDEFVVKTERVFTAAKEASSVNFNNISDSVFFSQPAQLATARVRSAKLWIYIRKAELQRPYLLLTVRRIFLEQGTNVILKFVYSSKINVSKAFGWKRIELRDIVVDWMKHPLFDIGLQIRAENDKGQNLVVLPPTDDIDKGYEPWLDIKIQEVRSNSRHKRSDSLVCSGNTTENRCCRYPLYVSFIDFGWEWIIAPTHVKADYCSGECRMTMQDNTPYSWVNQQLPGSAGSCCSPIKMSALPLLYFDENHNILYQILQNMKVEKCGCT